jgi:adenine/guanine phosphoribosyltransferase-like PRPP-binding protein
VPLEVVQSLVLLSGPIRKYFIQEFRSIYREQEVWAVFTACSSGLPPAYGEIERANIE